MRLSEGTPFKTCANPQARDQNINLGNLYENEMVKHIAIEVVQEHLLVFIVLVVRVVSKISVVFVKGDPHANHRLRIEFGKRGLLEKGSFQKSPF